jgi:hypothetical protein
LLPPFAAKWRKCYTRQHPLRRSFADADRRCDTPVARALPLPLLERWRARAQQEGVGPGMLLRQLMTQALDGQEAEVGLPVRAAQSETGRLSIALRHDELLAVRAQAKKTGHSLASWVRMLIRVKLKQQPMHTEDMLTLLSVLMELSATNRQLQRLHADRYAQNSPRREKDDATLMAVMEQVQAVHRYVRTIYKADAAPPQP